MKKYHHLSNKIGTSCCVLTCPRSTKHADLSPYVRQAVAYSGQVPATPWLMVADEREICGPEQPYRGKLLAAISGMSSWITTSTYHPPTCRQPPAANTQCKSHPNYNHCGVSHACLALPEQSEREILSYTQLGGYS